MKKKNAKYGLVRGAYGKETWKVMELTGVPECEHCGKYGGSKNG